MFKWVVVLLLLSGSCSDPGPQYYVEIVAIEQMTNSPYCTYRIRPVDPEARPLPPRLAFVDKCNKYPVGAKVSIEINDMK